VSEIFVTETKNSFQKRCYVEFLYIYIDSKDQLSNILNCIVINCTI